jgi:hypothetical protein
MYLALALTARYLDRTSSARTQPTRRAEDANCDEHVQTSQHPWHAPLNRFPQQASRQAADVPANAIRPGSAA